MRDSGACALTSKASRAFLALGPDVGSYTLPSKGPLSRQCAPLSMMSQGGGVTTSALGPLMDDKSCISLVSMLLLLTYTEDLHV